jgi:hypothetical protein
LSEDALEVAGVDAAIGSDAEFTLADVASFFGPVVAGHEHLRDLAATLVVRKVQALNNLLQRDRHSGFPIARDKKRVIVRLVFSIGGGEPVMRDFSYEVNPLRWLIIFGKSARAQAAMPSVAARSSRRRAPRG